MFNEMMGKCALSEKCCIACKKFINAMIDQPILGSLFIADFFLVLFINKTHWFFAILMVGGLVAVSLYYGQKLALFKMAQKEQAESASQTENAA